MLMRKIIEKQPRSAAKQIFDRHVNPSGWKRPPKLFITSDKTLAHQYSALLHLYLGGSELFTSDGLYHVTSKGYDWYGGGTHEYEGRPYEPS